MRVSNSSAVEMNVHLKIFDGNNSLVQECDFKNTATQRLTEGIAMFLAGDSTTQVKGRWRPNFISFATTGIDMQPYGSSDLAVVNDPEAFADKNPEEGFRTRPWYYSTRLGDRRDGFWDSSRGWESRLSTEYGPTFQGELATLPDDPHPIHRHQLLRGEVTFDKSTKRDFSLNGFSSDCILYGYSSVKWNNQFFEPEAGPLINRLAISEFGLYEGDIDTPEGQDSLLAGFRVPTVDDIVYIEKDYVMLVEWRIIIRALMPYETVGVGAAIPTGIKLLASVPAEKQVQMTAIVLGDSGISQKVNWSDVEGATDPGTTINKTTGLVTIGENENAEALYVTATSAFREDVWATGVIVLTGGGGPISGVLGIALSTSNVEDKTMQFQADVMGRGTFITDVEWKMWGNRDVNTTIDNTGKVVIGADETATTIYVRARSVGDPEVYAESAIVQMDLVAGEYIVSDFTLLTADEPEPVYDETKIAVIELNESGNPTDNVEYFEASSTHGEPASSEYIKANTDKNYFLRFGTKSMNGMIDRGFYDNCANINRLMLGCVTALASGCFSGCIGLKNLYIPDNIKYIYDNAFSGCTSLKIVRIPNATMGSAVFAGCTGIENVDFANDVETIGPAQFAMCSNIKTISLPSTLTAIYQNAFVGCAALATITINKPENSIPGAPWGAAVAEIIWTG